MKKNVIFIDLDNTIYPVYSIADKLFKSLFKHIDENREFMGDFEEVKSEIMRIPFQKVAEKFSFSKHLYNGCIHILLNLTFEGPMSPFPDYARIQNLPQKMFLVTSGFTKLQQSKVKQLRIKDDFESIHIIDPVISDLTKKNIFLQIINENNFRFSEILIVGDDLESEIQAGKELGIDAVLYDRIGKFSDNKKVTNITTFHDLIYML